MSVELSLLPNSMPFLDYNGFPECDLFPLDVSKMVDKFAN